MGFPGPGGLIIDQGNAQDSKNETGRWALPLEGPQRLSLSTRHGPPAGS